MTSQTLTKNSSEEQFIKIFQTEGLNGKAISSPAATRAKAALHELTFPTRKTEAWKYTNLKPLLKVPYSTRAQGSVKDIEPFKIPGLDADILVFVNGVYQPGLSDVSRNGSLFTISPLSDMTEENRKLFESTVGTLLDPDKDIFAALNTAYAHHGVLISIPAGKTAAAPVHLMNIHTAEGDPFASQIRNLVLIGQSAEVKVVETSHTTGQGQVLANNVTEIRVGKNAGGEWVKLQLESDQTSRIDRTEIYQESDSRFSVFTVTLSGQIIRNNLNIKLDGPNCESVLMGVYLLNELQHVDNHTMVDHIAPNCYSNELYKGIIDGKATGVFNGKIHVHQPAQKTNAFQSNRNILLSDTANIYTKPQLEIYADDVKCSHGATTGRLDEDAMFYLQARGIKEYDARMMLVHAFAMEVADNISIDPVREFVGELIDNRF